MSKELTVEQATAIAELQESYLKDLGYSNLAISNIFILHVSIMQHLYIMGITGDDLYNKHTVEMLRSLANTLELGMEFRNKENI